MALPISEPRKAILAKWVNAQAPEGEDEEDDSYTNDRHRQQRDT